MNEKYTTEQRKALALIHRFHPVCDGQNWAFPMIEKDDFLASLKELIQHPEGITQGKHPICGITCAIKVAAVLDPINLVKMAAHLFANGYYQHRSFLISRIKVPKNLSEVSDFHGLSAAEFVLTATIKSFYNPLTGYQANPNSWLSNWQGVTFPWQISKFLTTYFSIELVPSKNFRPGLAEIQNLVHPSIQIVAWTSWQQFKKPGSRIKLTAQHYVLIKDVTVGPYGLSVEIDNPKNRKDTEEYKFVMNREFTAAVLGVYGFRRK
jgi:hypothetical protein